MRNKFIISITLALIWLLLSIFLAIPWIQATAHYLPIIYIIWVIIGIALLPGFFMSAMFFSNLLHQKITVFPEVKEPVAILICAYNEEHNIGNVIHALSKQNYVGIKQIIIVDNASSDQTKKVIKQAIKHYPKLNIEYHYCARAGKTHALNYGFRYIQTHYFITLDADTLLAPNAVSKLMSHIIFKQSDCVAGNLVVQNTKYLVAKMQIYDYLLSISAIKRYQASYQSTLVAQGAFSVYRSEAVAEVGGWKEGLGEDIILTYQLLAKGYRSTYEAQAIAYTQVPTSIATLYQQRKRWAMGMIEGLRCVHPWNQGSFYAIYFSSITLGIIYLDLAYLFGFLPGIILACMGYYYFAGILTLLLLPLYLIFNLSFYFYQMKAGVHHKRSIIGFLLFIFCFQAIQSTAALHGYFNALLHIRSDW